MCETDASIASVSLDEDDLGELRLSNEVRFDTDGDVVLFSTDARYGPTNVTTCQP